VEKSFLNCSRQFDFVSLTCITSPNPAEKNIAKNESHIDPSESLF
jgi:hypothetical protein